MISNEIIEQNTKIYLRAFQKEYQQTQQHIKILEQRLNWAAKLIQRKYKAYSQQKKINKAKKIQKWWRSILKQFGLKGQQIKKFRTIFYVGCLQNLWRKNHNQKRNKQWIATISKKDRSIMNVCQFFPNFIQIKAAMKAQIQYIRKLRVYERNKFEKQWSLYEIKIKQEIWTQIKKKWVQKQKNLWINQFDKQVKVENFIQKKIEDLYNQNNKKLEQKDKKWNQEIFLLQCRINQITKKYESFLI